MYFTWNIMHWSNILFQSLNFELLSSFQNLKIAYIYCKKLKKHIKVFRRIQNDHYANTFRGWPLWLISLQITVRVGVHPRGWERQDSQVSPVPFPVPRRPTNPSACAACTQGVFPANQVNDYRPAPGTWQQPITAVRESPKTSHSPRSSPFRNIA